MVWVCPGSTHLREAKKAPIHLTRNFVRMDLVYFFFGPAFDFSYLIVFGARATYGGKFPTDWFESPGL